MSELVVTLHKVGEVKPHPNADKLEILYVGGWQVCEKIGKYRAGESVVFIPPDAILPEKLHTFLGVTPYCCHMPAASLEAAEGKMRVKAARLRGEPSYGVLMSCDQLLEYGGVDASQDLYGVDLKPYLGITKYEPPESLGQGDGERPHTDFRIYTDIQHYGNYHEVFVDGEPVIMTEKIHGENFRYGNVKDMDVWTLMCGTHRVRRKMLDKNGNMSSAWSVVDHNLTDMLDMVKTEWEPKFAVIVYGETYGLGPQDMKYGKPTTKNLVVYDISVDGEYLDWGVVKEYCRQYNIRSVPVVYEGPYSREAVVNNTSGPTLMCEPEAAGPFKGREGVVVKPILERRHPQIGRVVLKSVSADYLGRKNAKD